MRLFKGCKAEKAREKELQICDIRNKYKRSTKERQKIKRNENRR